MVGTVHAALPHVFGPDRRPPPAPPLVVAPVAVAAPLIPENPTPNATGRALDGVVEHPAHYTHGPLQVIELIEGFRLGFHLGAVLKYLLRWERKGGLQDLEKAAWYLERFIDLQLGRAGNPSLTRARKGT